MNLDKERLIDTAEQKIDTVGEKLHLNKANKGILDALQEKLVSRKLLVFITATTLMWFGLDPETWGLIAICYIGGQSVVDAAQVWKHGRSS